MALTGVGAGERRQDVGADGSVGADGNVDADREVSRVLSYQSFQ